MIANSLLNIILDPHLTFQRFQREGKPMDKSPKWNLPAVCAALALAGLFCLWTAPALSATIEEYITPTPDSSPTGLVFDAEGNLWFTEINGNKIGKLVPSEVEPGTSKGITEYELPHPNSKPHYITAARDGTIWFTEMVGRVGKIDPATGKITEFDVPTNNSEPHKIVEGNHGMIWFLEFEVNKVARLNPADGKIREYQIPQGNPHDLVIHEGRVWYTQGGKFWAQMFFNKVGYLDIESGKTGEIIVPSERSVPHGLAKADDGTLWFTQMFANRIAKLDYSSGPSPKVVEYLLDGRKGPHDLTVDDQRGFIWFTQNRTDSIGRLDLSKAVPGTSKGVVDYQIPTPRAHPSDIAIDKDGNIWFTEMGLYFRGKYQNKIGKLSP